MTRQEALDILTETRTLSTDLLKPLRISFDSWLMFCQFTEKQQQNAIDRLLKGTK
jgi:hypothetical protein